LIEKFAQIEIAQEIELPRDFRGFDYLAKLDGGFVLVTFVYRPIDTFSSNDIEEVLRRRDECARGCGWTVGRDSPRIFLFFIAHTVDQLQLPTEVLTRLAEVLEITPFRAVCRFEFGIYLTEIDTEGRYIEEYPREPRAGG